MPPDEAAPNWKRSRAAVPQHGRGSTGRRHHPDAGHRSYQDADTRTAAYGGAETDLPCPAQVGRGSICPGRRHPAEADANEHGTGYAADITPSTDYTAQDTGFADTRAYQWLTAYAAEYGFILRYPEDRQAITGVVFEPWHWRYVGVENALAIRASGLSLEEFLAEQKAL